METGEAYQERPQNKAHTDGLLSTKHYRTEAAANTSLRCLIAYFILDQVTSINQPLVWCPWYGLGMQLWSWLSWRIRCTHSYAQDALILQCR